MYYNYQDHFSPGMMFAGLFGAVCCGGTLVWLVIHAVVCYLLSNCFKAIPPQFRKQQPGMVWLLMIPVFSLVWNFFVYLKLSESYQAYFAAQGRTDVGDCGKQIALLYCIFAACTAVPVPHVYFLVAIAALVLLIIYMVKAYDLKKQIPQTPSV